MKIFGIYGSRLRRNKVESNWFITIITITFVIGSLSQTKLNVYSHLKSMIKYTGLNCCCIK